MKRRNFISLLAVMAAAGALSACGASSSSAGAGSTAASGSADRRSQTRRATSSGQSPATRRNAILPCKAQRSARGRSVSRHWKKRRTPPSW